MSISSLSSRAIIGRFYMRLSAVLATSWAGAVSMPFDSDQASEEYRWLGMVPAMREWLGGREPVGLRDNGLTIANKVFEATLGISVDDIRRDKTGQIMVRVGELATRAGEHWGKLLSTLIEANGLCYDGIAYYSAAHTEAGLAVQSNDITYDSASTTAPTVSEMEYAILASVQQLLGLTDDVGEPINANAREFGVMVPTSFFQATLGALRLSNFVDNGGSRSSLIANLDGFKFTPYINPRLTATTKFHTFRTDAETKPFIRQEEMPTDVAALAEGSEYEFINRAHLYTVTAIRNVGYGYWQQGCRTTFV